MDVSCTIQDNIHLYKLNIYVSRILGTHHFFKITIFESLPMSSKLEKYKKIIKNKEKKGTKCDILHIAKLDNNKESVFLIQDMFPITDEFVEKEYTISGNHLKVTSEHVAREIERKARKVLSLLKRDVRLSPLQPNVMKIYRQLNNKNYK